MVKTQRLSIPNNKAVTENDPELKF